MPRPLRGELAQPRVNLALGADVDAARRLVEQQQPRLAEDLLGQHDLLLVAAGQRADRDRRDSSAGCRTGRRSASPPPPRAPADIKPKGEMRRRTDMTRLRADRHAQHQPAAAPVVGDEGDAGAAGRADRAQLGRPAVDLDGARPAPGEAGAVERAQQFGAARRPSRRRGRRSRRHGRRASRPAAPASRRVGAAGTEARVAQSAAAGVPIAGRARGIELVERAADEQPDQLGLRRIRRGGAGDAAVAHHRHAVGDLRHLLQPVRDVDDADAARRASRRMMPNSRSTSPAVSAAVGSSMISTREA